MTSGTIVAKLKYGIFPLPTQNLDLCTTAKDANITCPVAEGNKMFTAAAKVPNIGVSCSHNSVIATL